MQTSAAILLFVISVLLVSRANGVLCPNNLGNDFFIVVDATLFDNAESACAAHGGLMFAQVPDVAYAQGLSLLLTVCGGTSMWVKGFQGQGPMSGGMCARLNAITSLVQILAGIVCDEQAAFVLCTDKAEFAAIVDLSDETELTTTTTLTRTTTTTQVSTTSIGSSTTITTQGTDTVVTLSVETQTTTLFTTTVPQPTSTAGTVTVSDTSVITETTGDETVLNTVTVGPVTVTFTQLIPVTVQTVEFIESTLTIIGTDFLVTCIPTVITTTQTIISTSTSISLSTITQTSIRTTTATVPPVCPTGRISSCPCNPSAEGFVLVTNDAVFEAAACACDRIGASLAVLDQATAPLAATLLRECSSPRDCRRGAWIGEWQGSAPPAGLCFMLRPDGQVIPGECGTKRQVMCQVAPWKRKCHQCQFDDENPCCRKCPKWAREKNAYCATCNQPDSSSSAPKRRKHKRDAMSGSDNSSGGAGSDDPESSGHASESADSSIDNHHNSSEEKSLPLLQKSSKAASQISYNLCPFTSNMIYAISSFQDGGIGLSSDQACGLQGGSLLNVTSGNRGFAVQVLGLCGLPDGWVRGFAGLHPEPGYCAFLQGPGGGADWQMDFYFVSDWCGPTFRPVLCQWSSKSAIPDGDYFRDMSDSSPSPPPLLKSAEDQQDQQQDETEPTNTVTVTVTSTIFQSSTTTVVTSTSISVVTTIVTTVTQSGAFTLTSTVRTDSTPPATTITETTTDTTVTSTALVASTVTSNVYDVIIETDIQQLLTPVATSVTSVYLGTESVTATLTVVVCPQ